MLKYSKISINGNSILSKYIYDNYGKINSTETLNSSKTSGIRHKFFYKDHRNLIDSMEINSISTDNQIGLNKKISYTYDDRENITEIKNTNGNLIVSYFYDDSSQLIRENNNDLKQTIVYIYDSGSNIQEKKIYKFNDSEDLSNFIPENIIRYNYSDSNWKDKMTSYNSQKITYDAIGNPVVYKDGWKLEWSCGKRLSKALKIGYNIDYKYDDDGIRTQKTVNGTKTDYVTCGTKILAQKSGNEIITYIIDGNDVYNGFDYNGKQYLYIKNIQGDIIGITDNSGNAVSEYVYDSWGKVISITENTSEQIGHINPIRYRGYFYDNETEFYYLNARYYDPETCRFLNADEEDVFKEDNNISNYNLFSYCGNNPITRSDPDGKFFWIAVGAAVVGTSSYFLGKQYGLSGWKLALVTAVGAGIGGLVGHWVTPLLKPVMCVFINWGHAVGAESRIAGYKFMLHWDHHRKGYHVVLQRLTQWGNWRTIFERGFK